MKITIDTKEDSKDDIRKAIKMLQALVESGEISYKEPVSSEQQTAMRGMFDSSTQDNIIQSNDGENHDEDNDEEKDDTPAEIMTY